MFKILILNEIYLQIVLEQCHQTKNYHFPKKTRNIKFHENWIFTISYCKLTKIRTQNESCLRIQHRLTSMYDLGNGGGRTRISRKSHDPLVYNWTSHSEMVQTLKARVFYPQNLVHWIIEIAPYPGC